MLILTLQLQVQFGTVHCKPRGLRAHYNYGGQYFYGPKLGWIKAFFANDSLEKLAGMSSAMEHNTPSTSAHSLATNGYK